MNDKIRDQSFCYLSSWLDSHKDTSPKCRTAVAELLPLLAGSGFLRDARVKDEPVSHGHQSIEFWPPSPTGIGRPRIMKMVHAAIVRFIELAGGTIGYGNNDDNGRYRFKLWLRIGSLKTLLPHILFGTPVRGRLYERPGEYHALIPASFRFKRSPNRADVIAAVRGRCGDQVAALLTELFALADKWHGDELEIGGDDEEETGAT